MYIPGLHGTPCANQAAFELRNLPAFAYLVLRLETCATKLSPGLPEFYSSLLGQILSLGDKTEETGLSAHVGISPHISTYTQAQTLPIQPDTATEIIP